MDKLLDRVCCDATRNNGFNLKEDQFRLDVTKKFFPMRVVRHRFPREAVGAPSWKHSRLRLDGVLSKLIWWNMFQIIVGGLV